MVLVLVLALLQALSLGPLKPLRRRWPLSSEQASQPRQAWRWLSQAWIHSSGLEACINLILLLILLTSPTATHALANAAYTVGLRPLGVPDQDLPEKES